MFDLDDTLFPERDFVVSGFRAVSALLGEGSFERMLEQFEDGEKDVFGRELSKANAKVKKCDLLAIYRYHCPDLNLNPKVFELLEKLRSAGHPLGLITDGRSVTQRNKIEALGINHLLNEVVISEEFGSAKPDERNFLHFERVFPGRRFVYVGDNPEKDFLAPNRLGWITVCLLDSGCNVHHQDFEKVAPEFLPQYRIKRIS